MKRRPVPDWSAYSPGEFIHLLVNDMQREMQDIESLIAFMIHDEEAATTSVENLSRKMMVQEICELILRRKDNMNDILYLAANYAESAKH